MLSKHPPFTQARWIWTADQGHSNFAVRRFQAVFRLDAAETLRLSVSADSRYVLFFDGKPLGRGPARSDVRHYVYETYEVDAEAGEHTLAAVVLAYRGASCPIAELHEQGAFVLEAQNADGKVVCATSGEAWRVQTDTAWAPKPITKREDYFGIGALEQMEGARIPLGWEQPGYDTSGWESPSVLFDACERDQPNDTADSSGRWRLVPRDIPHLREEPRRFMDWLGTITVEPGTRREIILNAGEYAIGFPVLSVEGGAGAAVEIVYTEALTKDGVKGVRDDPDGTDVIGYSDTYLCGGGTETYTPLHWRAFRFVKLIVQTAEVPLIIRDFSYLLTGYPWKPVHAFTAENGPQQLAAVLEVDFRTLERCSAETFMDCPYYEQLQYVGDTRLQALLSYVTTGDTRLGARAVKLFDWSRGSEGLTQSRYPSRMEQIIPPFSLLWILMVEDLWRYAPDEAGTVAASLPGCRSVLDWFAGHLSADGVVGGGLPWWNFVDWAEGWFDAPAYGVPLPEAAGQPSATINLQFLAALQACTRLNDALGDAEEAERWRLKADTLAAAITRTFWDEEQGIVQEGPGRDWRPTQHAQAWGILTGVIPVDAWPAVAERLHSDKALTPATYYHLFYIAEALAKADRLDLFWNHWMQPWRNALNLHLSTWPEQPEPTRSDCHAWSAWPTYCLLTHVLGVQPSAPGFRSYTITPRHVQGWDKVSGILATPAGPLSVSVDWTKGGSPQVTQSVQGR